MKNIKFAIMAIVLGLVLTGCGRVVEVPPAYEGKVLSKSGYQPDEYPPSTFRLNSCWMPGQICDQLVLVEKSDRGVTESFDVFMPKNQLKMKFDLRMTASIRDGSTNAILNKVPATSNENPGISPRWDKQISFEQVYQTYAQPIIRDSVRAIVAEYTIDEIASSRDAINAKIRQRLDEVLSGTPILLKTAGLAKVDYPEVITKRKEQAEERRIEIEQEESRKQVRLIQLQTELEAAKAQRAIRREKAEAAAEENKIAAGSITPEYLEYKKLEVLDNIAKSGGSVFVPFEALDEVGLSQKVFGAGDK